MAGAIGVEIDCPLTPAMLRKVAYAGTQSNSFGQAAKDLEALAEVKVTTKRVERWTKRVGEARVVEREQQAEAYQELPLPQRQKSPQGRAPQVACVMMDGGRIQIRDRAEAPQRREEKGHWKESLVGCCLSMTSEEHAEDPCPTIPRTFVDPARMHELSREIKGFSGDAAAAEPPPDAPEDRAGRPEVLVKSVVATRQGIDKFGKRLVAEAHARGFHAAPRKAFVADGSSTNWSVHKQHFSHYMPIVDFTHAICYVYAAAVTGRSLAAAWPVYCQWAQWLWEGNLAALIEAVQGRLAELGPPNEQESATSPRNIVADVVRYLTNQQSRMKYAAYRKLGLPITSSHIESTIKQINRRVKGTEKFWDHGAEPLLQLAADHLSDTTDFDRFWTRRPKQIQPTRCYQTAV